MRITESPESAVHAIAAQLDANTGEQQGSTLVVQREFDGDQTRFAQLIQAALIERASPTCAIGCGYQSKPDGGRVWVVAKMQ